MSRTLITIFALLTTCVVWSDEAPAPSVCPIYLTPNPYELTYDPNFSPYAGAENILLAHRMVAHIEKAFAAPFCEPGSKSPSARLFRLAELTFVWLPINSYALVMQHEVFGHGYRIRDLGRSVAKVNSYHIHTPPPYGNGGGSTHFLLNPSLFTSTDDSAVSMAGVESTAILAGLIKSKWIQNRKIDPRQIVLYLLSQHDLNLYVGTLEGTEQVSGHDIHGYIRAVNFTYPDSLLTTHKLHNLSWINLVDPLTFYSFYAWFRYVDVGKETHIPMIASRYLPNLRLGLSPFGPEIFLENFFTWNQKTALFYLKGGAHPPKQFFGLGTLFPSLFETGLWSLGARFDLWKQPDLLLFPGTLAYDAIPWQEDPSSLASPLYSSKERGAHRWGAAVSLLAEYELKEKSFLHVEVGGKSKGFLPGYSLQSYPTLRVGWGLLY